MSNLKQRSQGKSIRRNFVRNELQFGRKLASIPPYYVCSGRWSACSLFCKMGRIKMLKNLILAAAIAGMPVAASAVTISSDSQIDISGTVNLDNSDFSAGGNVDLNDPGFVIFSTGDFGGVPIGSLVSLTDVDFSAPGAIWSVGGFTYTATSYSDITNGTEVGFMSYGVITGNGFDATAGMLNLSGNPLNGFSTVSFSSTTAPVPVPAGFLLMGTALAGLGLARRKA